MRGCDVFPGAAAIVHTARAARAARRAARTTLTGAAMIATGRLRPSDDPRVQASRLSAACREAADTHGWRRDVVGALPAGPCIVVANHVSYVDPIVLIAEIPMLPIAKGEVASWPLVGEASQALGVNFVDRGRVLARARTLRRALAQLEAGGSVLNFAEGTTTDGTHLLPFHRGIFGLSIRTGVPIVPVALTFDDPSLTWTGNATFAPHYWRTAQRRTSRARIVVRAPVTARPGERAEELAARVRATIARTLGLRDQPVRGDHVPAERVRVPPPWPVPVLPPRRDRSAGAA